MITYIIIIVLILIIAIGLKLYSNYRRKRYMAKKKQELYKSVVELVNEDLPNSVKSAMLDSITDDLKKLREE